MASARRADRAGPPLSLVVPGAAPAFLLWYVNVWALFAHGALAGGRAAGDWPGWLPPALAFAEACAVVIACRWNLARSERRGDPSRDGGEPPGGPVASG